MTNKYNHLVNKVIFMTGATSGFGQVIAKYAAGEGAHVVALIRSKEKANQLQESFKKESPAATGTIEFIEGNLSSLKSVAKACQVFNNQYSKVDIIINNAGIINFEYRESEDQIEETLQVNLLAPFLITYLLYDKLVKETDSKIIITTSGMHRGTIDFNNMEFKENFSSFKSYSQSKLAIILLCRFLSNALERDSIGIYSIHPGVVRTEIARNANWFSKMLFPIIGKSIEKGARTHIYLLEKSNTVLESGEYYVNSKIGSTTKIAHDMQLAEQVYKKVYEYLMPYISTSNAVFDKSERGV